MNHRTVLLAAGILGATGVALGAYGAHALRAFLMERGMSVAWETAVRYHLWHAIALLPLGVWLRVDALGGERLARWAAGCWIAGVVVFSGSLYLLALGGPRWLGPVTPLGGLALVAGWLFVAVAAFTKKKT